MKCMSGLIRARGEHMVKFLQEKPAYLRWARILTASGNRIGGVVLIRDAMASHGVAGFTILDAVKAIQGVLGLPG